MARDDTCNEPRDTSPTAAQAFGRLSVVVPAYNAEAFIAATLESILRYVRAVSLEHELIVVDDGSIDRTAELAARYAGEGARLLSSERNRGKGHAVRRGMREARGDWILFMDVDNSTSIDHLERFAPHAARADVLIASRRLEESVIVRPQPKLRQLLGRTFPHIVRALTLPAIRDTQCGFKVFRREAARAILPMQQSDGFCFDVEVLLIASRLGYRIVELPVRWDNPPESTIRVGLDPARMLVDLLRIVWRHRRGRYGGGATVAR